MQPLANIGPGEAQQAGYHTQRYFHPTPLSVSELAEIAQRDLSHHWYVLGLWTVPAGSGFNTTFWVLPKQACWY